MRSNSPSSVGLAYRMPKCEQKTSRRLPLPHQLPQTEHWVHQWRLRRVEDSPSWMCWCREKVAVWWQQCTEDQHTPTATSTSDPTTILGSKQAWSNALHTRPRVYVTPVTWNPSWNTSKKSSPQITTPCVWSSDAWKRRQPTPLPQTVQS